jgi:hypothetical protein
MRIPKWVPQSVVFLGQRVTEGRREVLRLGGTAFAVSVPWPGSVSCHRYLVTARHTTLKLQGREHVIRANTKDGSRKELVVKGDVKWWTHPTEEKLVDAAVLPFESIEGDLSDVDVTPIEVTRLLSSDRSIDEYYIDQGDEVYIAGLFTKLTGDSRNLPIARAGTIAMMPTDRIPNVNLGDEAPVDIEGYLVELRSVGGLSGSPVFVRASIGIPCNVFARSGEQRIAEAHVPGDFFLLGLVHGHWEIHKNRRNSIEIEPVKRDDDSINLGIAIVVPARKVLEIINRHELVEMRKRKEKESRQKESTTTPDRAIEIQDASKLSKKESTKSLKRVSRRRGGQSLK